MRRPDLSAVIRRAGADPGEPDAALLERFTASGDQAAFVELVRRYSRLVWGRCRVALACAADAEDALQATFLALARHARGVRDPNRLGPWLYAVAGRVCRNARRAAARRAAHEARAAVPDAARPVADAAWDRAAAAVHEEVGRLPPSLREAFVLCGLEGKAQEAAADQLGLSRTALATRLSRAKQRLLERLAVRGVGAGVAFAALCDAAPSASALDRAADSANPPAPVLSLLPGAVPVTLAHPKLILLFGALAVGAFTLLLPIAAQDPPRAMPAKPAEGKARTDRHGDPLPDRAVLRLGTVRDRVPGIAGVGFKTTGELVVLTYRLELHTFPADGGPAATVTRLPNRSGGATHGRAVLSADARFAAAHLSAERKVVVWDVSGKEPVEHLSREVEAVDLKGISPDGGWLAVRDRTLRAAFADPFADLAAKEWKAVPKVEFGFLDRIAFTPDGKRLSVASGDAVRVFDTATRDPLLSATVPDVTLLGTALSPDGTAVAVVPVAADSGKPEAVRALSVPGGKPLDGWTGPTVAGDAVGFTPGGRTLWASGRGRVREWDPKAAKWVHDVAAPAGGQTPTGEWTPTGLVWSPDGKRLVTHNDHAFAVLDARTWKPLHPEPLAAGPTDVIGGVTVSPDGRTIATEGAVAHLWDAATGELLGTVGSTNDNRPTLAFLPDSKTLLTAADGQPPVECDARTGKVLRRFALPDDLAGRACLRHLRLSADGTTLEAFARSDDAKAKTGPVRWDVATGKVAWRTEVRVEEPVEDFHTGGWSPDGVWRVADGSAGRADGAVPAAEVVPPAEVGLTGSSWSADSRRVAVPRAAGRTVEDRLKDEANSLVVFDVAKGERVVELPAGRVSQSGFSGDGKRLATVTESQVAVWDLSTGRQVFAAAAAPGHFLAPRGVAFTPDGRRLVTAHGTHCLVWDVPAANGK